MRNNTATTATPAQRQQLRDDGYFISEPLIDTATLDGVQQEFQRLWDEDLDKARRDGNAKHLESVSLRPFMSMLERRSAVCAAFCKHPALLALARSVIGVDDLDVTWNQAIIKPPANGKAFGWHQDSHYAVTNDHATGVDRELYLSGTWGITFWIAITRTTIANGTLWVVPGRHREGLLPHLWSNEELEWQCQFDSSGKRAAELNRGQALLFTGLTPHCSGPNVSDEVRMAYQIGYGRPGVLKNNYQIPALRAGLPV